MKEYEGCNFRCQFNDHYCKNYNNRIYIYFKLESFKMIEFYFDNCNNPGNLNNFNFEIIEIKDRIITQYIEIYSDNNVKIHNNNFKSFATKVYENLLFL